MQRLGRFGRPAWIGALGLAIVLALVAPVADLLFSASVGRIVTLFLIYVIAVLGFQIYSGNSGILSFGHVSFMAIGAYASALLTMAPAVQQTALPQLPGWIAAMNGQSLPVAVLGASLVVLVAAIIFGLPIARLGGSAAAIATLGILVITHVVLVATPDITRGSQTFFGIPRGVPIWLAGACAAGAAVTARLYRSSRSGLALRASREDEIAAIAMGVRVDQLRFQSFILGAMLCGVSGALLAHFLGAFSPKDFYFNLTFLLLSMLILGGISTVSGAVLGAAVIMTLVQVLRGFEQGVDLGFVTMPQFFGLTDIGIGATILLVMYRMREGLTGVREPSERLVRMRPAPAASALPTDHGEAVDPGTRLQVENVGKRFGGLVALDGVSFAVETGRITGLIGPNGAGKSTLINAICGIVPASSGRVMIGDRDVADLAVHEVPLAGLGRTFQNIRLFGNLTVAENVQVAANSAAGPDGDSIMRDALDMVGLTELKSRLAATLPYGAQRRLEIARALALRPRFLLLDEPAAGMNPIETDELLAVLRRIRDEYRLGILIVEHDLKLIMSLCDQIVVLDKGRQIAMGTPAEMRADPAVIAAYIGPGHAAQAASNPPAASDPIHE